MKKITFFCLICLLSTGLFSSNEKSYLERLERLKTIIDVDFVHGLGYQNKVIGLKNLDDLIHHDQTTRAYFGKDKIIKKVIITDKQSGDPEKISLREYILFYKFDGSESEQLIKWRLHAFVEELQRISVMQHSLQSYHENIKFVRAEDYQLPSSNTLYIEFLDALNKVLRNLSNGDLASKFHDLDEIVIIDKQVTSDKTNIVYEELRDYRYEMIKRKMTIYFNTNYHLETFEYLEAYLKALVDITLRHGFKTVYSFEPKDELVISGVMNLASVLNASESVGLLKEKKVRSFYLNSQWNEMNDIIDNNGMLTVGISRDDIKKAIDLFLL